MHAAYVVVEGRVQGFGGRHDNVLYLGLGFRVKQAASAGVALYISGLDAIAQHITPSSEAWGLQLEAFN